MVLSFLKRVKKDVGLVGIEVSKDGIAIAHVVNNLGSGLWVRRCDFINITEKSDKKLEITKKINELGLADLPCNWVLRPSNYSLLLVEAPNVPREEMREAVRWRIKDLIPISVENAAIDIFDLPDDGTRSGKKMIYVVAAEKNSLIENLDIAKAAKIKMSSIDIVELAIRNISELMSDDERGVAVVRLRPGTGNLMLMRNDKLYLSRQFDLNYNGGLFDELPEESLILELQRSLDYYERQMGQAAPTTIYFCGDNISEDKITSTMKNSLSGAVKFLSLDEKIRMPKEFDEHKIQMCIGAIGGALRLRAI